jgi:hypothetical protein
VNLCHQIVDSFVLTFSCDESTDLFDGIYVSSDYDRDKLVFLVRATDFIALCRDIGMEDVYSKTYARDDDGRLRVTEVLGEP